MLTGRTLLRRIPIPALIVVWLPTVVAGLGRLWAYAETPGAAANAPSSWPESSRTRRLDGTPSLVLFLHPQCACSTATLAELAMLLAHVPQPVDVRVWIYRPAEMPDGWERTSLWQDAAAMPGVHVATDLDGAEARRFGARVSGETMLFDRDGRLRFHGGITPARGHQGDSTGRDILTTLLNGGTVTADNTPVFGCLIHNAAS